MVSCLAVLHSTHVPMGSIGEFGRTECGLMIPCRHGERDLFAVDFGAATCEHCRDALDRRKLSAVSGGERVDAKTLVANFLEQMGTQGDVAGWADVLGDNLPVHNALKRRSRLHELFPTWLATVDELIAEGDRVVARYRVGFTDPFNLLGIAEPPVRRDQVVIVRLRNQKIIEVQAIVDDFGVWADADIQGFGQAGRHAHELETCGS
jgi:predicted ester cyclase